MTQIKKLMVQGIRSFNPAEDAGQVIEFFSPMTLIVGQNGCGKTTIIEALKYCITGTSPPNSKNGAHFVNDPKLSTGYEVKAHVKLELLDGKNNKVVVGRKLKGTTKGKHGSVSTSTVEVTVAQYLLQPNGKRNKVEMNSKCGDCQEAIGQLMGVSEAILNTVIFCHQEDSCWPLDEASKVKLKFDAIFNTTMYIKALKSLQDKEKAMVSDIKLAKQAFLYTSDNLAVAKKKREKLEEEKLKLSAIDDKSAEYDRELEQIKLKIQSLEKLRQNYEKETTRVNQKQGQIDSLEQVIREFKQKITEPFEGDMDELLLKINRFESQFIQKKNLLKDLDRQKHGKVEERKRLEDKNKVFIRSQGVFENESSNNEKQVAEMEKLMDNLFKYIRNLKDSSQSQGQEEDFSRSLDVVLMSFEQDVESVVPSTALKALDSAISAKEEEQKKLKTKLDSEIEKLRAELSELNKSETDINTQVSMNLKREKETKDKVSELWKRLNELETSGDALLLLNDQEQRCTESIERLERSELTKNFETEITQLQREIVSLEQKKDELQDQRSLLTEDLTLAERIRAINSFKLKKRGECNEILRRIEPQLKNLLEDTETIPEENLSAFLQKKLKKLTNELTTKTEEQNKIGKEIVKIETSKKQLIRELEKNLKEVTQIKREAELTLNGASFEEEYANIFDETEEAQSQVSENNAASVLFKQYVKELEKKSCCPLCKRNFAKERENAALVQDLTEKMKKMELNKPQEETKLADLKVKQKQLVELKPLWETKEKLEKIEIPKLRKKLEEYDVDLRNSLTKFEDLKDSVSVITLDKSSAESLQKDTTLFDKSDIERKGTDSEIKKVESSRDTRAKELTVTLEDVQSELQSVESTISARRREKDTKEQLKNKKAAELTKAREERNNVISDKLKLTGDLQNKDTMSQQKKDLETQATTLRTTVTELNRKLPNLRTEISQTLRQISDLTKKRETSTDALQTEKAGLMSQKDRLNHLHKEIEAFRSKQEKYESESKSRNECATQLTECEAIISELSREIGIIASELNSQGAQKTNLDFNKIVKEKETERDKFNSEISEDRKALETSKVRGLTTQLNDEYRKNQEIYGKKHRNDGSVGTMKENIRSMEEELDERKYANAEVDHRKDLIKKTVLERAQKDIRLYRVALDSAVMTFHRKKMETINKFLSFYWKKIYKGNDIDYIQIRTENDESEAEKSTVNIDMSKTQRKSYNYRVVMVRRGIELDMRGRCSAGQKVLASIIIRLAIAQTFSSLCGIITLDEPTTNLDKQNIDSLAETLSDLALSMKTTSTFQLVVITHDQEFIDTLLRVDPIDYYYKVSRDRMGFSLIERIAK